MSYGVSFFSLSDIAWQNNETGRIYKASKIRCRVFFLNDAFLFCLKVRDGGFKLKSNDCCAFIVRVKDNNRIEL